MSENEKYRLHAFVRGSVQGVGFRHFTRQTAQEHALTGWVRNLRDGRVEIMAEGEPDALNQLLVRLRKGPISADVNNINYEFDDAQEEFNTFRVRHTA